MNQQRRSEINRFADAVRGFINVDGPPFDMDEAVRSLRGEVVELEGDDIVSTGEASVQKVGTSFEVRVRPAADTRRRFNIAHELGHLFLHMGFKVDPDKWAKCPEREPMNRSGASEEEYEAHEFAGALLMPEAEFREVIGRHQGADGYDTAAIALHFGVSVHAATTRGRWLGLFSWS